MANLRAVLQDQEARRLVDEDPDQHSHPLFRQSPGRKMQGAQGREGIKRNRTRNERFQGSGDGTQKTNRRTDPREGDGRKATDEAAGPKDQAPRLKQGTDKASRTGQYQTCIATTNPVEGSEAPRNHSPEAGATQERAQAQRNPQYQDDSKYFTKKIRSDSTSATDPRDTPPMVA